MTDTWDEKLYEWCEGCSSYYPTGRFWTTGNIRCRGYYSEFCLCHILKLEAIRDIVSTDLSNHDKLSAIEDILGGGIND